MLAAACAALIADVGAHGRKNIVHLVKGIPVAADHDGQRALLRAHVAAGNRRVQRGHAFFLGRGIDALGKARAGGGHVDQNRALVRAVQNALFGEIDFLHVFGITHDRDDHIASRSAIRNGIAPVCAGGDHALCLGLGTGINAHVKAFFHQIEHHGAAHDAHADKADLHEKTPP